MAKKMKKKIGRIALLLSRGWGIGGFSFFSLNAHPLVPLMNILIAVVALGFLVISES